MLAGLRVTLSEEETSERLASDTGDVIVHNKLSWGHPAKTGLSSLRRLFDGGHLVRTPRRASPRLARHVQCRLRKTRKRARGRRERRRRPQRSLAPPSASDLGYPTFSRLCLFRSSPSINCPPCSLSPPPLLAVPIRRATHARVIPLVLLQLACSPPHTTAPGRLGTNAP